MQNFYPITGVNEIALSFEEEIKLLRLWLHRRSKAGDAKQRAARETLIKNYLLFAVKTVGEYYKALPEDDVLRVAHMTLILSIDKWTDKREKVGRIANMIPLYAKVAYRKFKRDAELVKCPAKNETEGRYVSLDAKVSEKGSGSAEHENHETGIGEESEAPEVNLDELLGVQNPDIDQEEIAERQEAVKRAVAALEPRQKQVIMFVYYDRLDFAATARKMRPSCSREWVRQLHDRALKFLKAAMEKSEEN